MKQDIGFGGSDPCHGGLKDSWVYGIRQKVVPSDLVATFLGVATSANQHSKVLLWWPNWSYVKETADLQLNLLICKGNSDGLLYSPFHHSYVEQAGIYQKHTPTPACWFATIPAVPSKRAHITQETALTIKDLAHQTIPQVHEQLHSQRPC